VWALCIRACPFCCHSEAHCDERVDHSSFADRFLARARRSGFTLLQDARHGWSHAFIGTSRLGLCVPVTGVERVAARDTAFFALWGSPLKKLIGAMSSLRAIHWSSLLAAGWPDANTIYLEHTTQRERVDGHTVLATRWVQRDATNPMDLGIAGDDRLIAAIDVANDVVLVRRGYATTSVCVRSPTRSRKAIAFASQS
jgi:hypothetical protein